jgi:cell division control protein 45
MLLKQNDVEAAYDQINHDAAEANGACSVLIFVAPNADAMCACRILCSMLRSDVISYKIVPVNGYADLDAANAELITGNEDLRTVIMLNCGARRNMEKVLSGLPANARAYIADAHRPVHLANLYSEEKVWVLDDGPLGMDEGVLSDGDELSDDPQSDSDEDEDTDDDENAAASEEEEEFEEGSDEVGTVHCCYKTAVNSVWFLLNSVA